MKAKSAGRCAPTATSGQAPRPRISDRLAVIETERPELPGLALGVPAVMGVVNVTPDSFSDGGRFADTASAIAQGEALVAAGADMLDIGGESTRPGAEATPDAEELQRVIPVIEGLVQHRVPISIDTRKTAVMRGAAEAGAVMVNDVTALRHDPEATATACVLGLPVMLMHSAGDPKTMQDNPVYDDVALDVFDALAERVAVCADAGIARDGIVIDPGIGFGKTFAHNHEILRNLTLYHGLGLRLALGVSRKAFIGALSGEKVAGKRVAGSVAAALVGVAQGVHILQGSRCCGDGSGGAHPYRCLARRNCVSFNTILAAFWYNHPTETVPGAVENMDDMALCRRSRVV